MRRNAFKNHELQALPVRPVKDRMSFGRTAFRVLNELEVVTFLRLTAAHPAQETLYVESLAFFFERCNFENILRERMKDILTVMFGIGCDPDRLNHLLKLCSRYIRFGDCEILHPNDA